MIFVLWGFFFILNHVDYSDFGICNLIFYSFIILLIMKIIFSWRVALSAKAASLCCVFQITRELRSLNVLYPANTFPRLIHILPFYLKLMLIFFYLPLLRARFYFLVCNLWQIHVNIIIYFGFQYTCIYFEINAEDDTQICE